MLIYLILFSGICWLIPVSLFTPSVVRVWFNRADSFDVMLCPVAFVSANQVGYVLRWLIFPHAIQSMLTAEIIMWAGLYTLSSLSALSLVGVWRIVRRAR